MYKYALGILAGVCIVTAIERIGIGAAIDEVAPIVGKVGVLASNAIYDRTDKVSATHGHKLG